VIVWIGIIYTTIPLVRAIREWYVARWDPLWIGWAVAAVLAAATWVALVLLRRRSFEIRRGAVGWIIGVTVVMILWTLSLRRSPEEAVHFLEYGALALLLHRALRPAIPDAGVFIAGALAGALVGTVDEVIQWVSPNRFWDWRDLALNAGAGGLVQLALWRSVPPAARRATRPSSRLVLRLAVVQLLLLTLCLANTPRRVARYAPLLPGCAHLTSSRNPMAEYGRLHEIEGLGSFKSRLELARLATEDHTRAAEVGTLVDGSKHAYGRFLDTWPVSSDPFTYELRVHLFARDRNLGKARQRDFDGSLAREQLSRAWSENLLVEKFFGSTLAQSSYTWKTGIRNRVDSARDPDFAFRSAAGSHLITIASERTIRFLLLIVIAAMIILDVRSGVPSPPKIGGRAKALEEGERQRRSI
jgi:hypothetical protein